VVASPATSVGALFLAFSKQESRSRVIPLTCTDIHSLPTHGRAHPTHGGWPSCCRADPYPAQPNLTPRTAPCPGPTATATAKRCVHGGVTSTRRWIARPRPLSVLSVTAEPPLGESQRARTASERERSFFLHVLRHTMVAIPPRTPPSLFVLSRASVHAHAPQRRW